MIAVGTFSGEIPRLEGRYLPDTGAQLAFNVRLNDGALTPTRIARVVATLAAKAASIYKHQDQWLSWPVPVNVAPGPVAQDRLYVTGDGKPKVIAGGQTWDLAIPPPPTALAVESQGTVDPANSVKVAYAYTYLSQLDEESEPSPLSVATDFNAGMTNVLTGFNPAPPPRITRMRIYRSQTGASGSTGLFFIAERAYSTAPFVDAFGANPIVEAIPSVSYNAPPDDLAGLIALPNGMMAAFVGKRLYFSEPYRPHAWPEAYILTTDYPIVALGAFGSSLAVMTTGHPYVATGTAPENMVMERLELNLPCLNARGVVDLGYSVAYPSHQGLVTIGPNGAGVVTENTISRERWLELGPETFIAGQYDGRYMASYVRTVADVEDRGIIVVDTTGQVPFITRSADSAEAMHYEIQTGALFMLNNGVEVWQWDAPGEANGEIVWRSKPFIFGGATNFAFLMMEAESSVSPEQAEAIRKKIEEIRKANREMMDAGSIGGEVGGAMIAGVTFAGDRLIPTDDYTGGGGGIGYEEAVAVTVYADKKPIATITKTNEPVRLPGGFLARRWEFEVRGNMRVLSVAMGYSPTELTAT